MAVQSEVPPVAFRWKTGPNCQLPKRGGSVGLAEFQGLWAGGDPSAPENVTLGSDPEKAASCSLRLEWNQEKKLIQEALI